jgi:3'-phosphoadenosine 5'-phosphosulfate sulfotransferase (PAPS reductase)/FAD synthetase
MNLIISSSYGNDSVALIEYIRQLDKYEGTRVVFIDTGWSAPGWMDRVDACEDWVKSIGFRPVRLKSMGMEELVRMKKGFPANQYQFCTMHLKGIPFLQWIDEADPIGNALVCIGKRRAESSARAETPEFIPDSDYHGGRTVWNPLFKHTDTMRNALLASAGFDILPNRSQECSPCVNANRGDFLLMDASQVERVGNLEVEIGKPMFRPKRFGALGIHGVMAWAKHGRKRMELEEDEIVSGSGCDGHYGCGL